MPNPVAPPKADPLAVDEADTISPRPLAELLAPVMELRDCSRAAAEQYIHSEGRVAVERELAARWR
jgi:hypothetical protein